MPYLYECYELISHYYGLEQYEKHEKRQPLYHYQNILSQKGLFLLPSAAHLGWTFSLSILITLNNRCTFFQDPFPAQRYPPRELYQPYVSSLHLPSPLNFVIVTR